MSLKYSKTKGVELIIEDNGKGFEIDDLDVKDDGRGVNNIKTKVLAFDGTHLLESALGEGVRLSLSFKKPKLK